MAYNIINYSNTESFNVDNNTIVFSTGTSAISPINLIGRNKANFGSIINTNFLWMTENFASDYVTDLPNTNNEWNNGPIQSREGQLWYSKKESTSGWNIGVPKICVHSGTIGNENDSWQYQSIPVVTVTSDDSEIPYELSFTGDTVVTSNTPYGALWVTSNDNSIKIHNGLTFKEILTVEEVAQVPEYDTTIDLPSSPSKKGFAYDNDPSTGGLKFWDGLTWKLVNLT